MQFRAQSLGDLAEQPAATRVFLRRQLDFCCGGKRTLAEACAGAGLDVTAVEQELAAEVARGDDTARWSARPQAELADHIESHYHAALRRDVPALVEAARKVERVHAAKPAVPRGLADELAAFWIEMQDHMRKEELILFPLLRRGASSMATHPIHRMLQEHDEHARRLVRIRELAGDLQPPPHGCATWRALYAGLATMEAELRVHIHLENNVLFARALEAA